MAHPFQTTRQRRAGFVFVAWVYVVAAIIYRVTGATTANGRLLTVPGGFYRTIRDTLQQFATSTAVGSTVVLTIYLGIALVLVTLAMYLFDVFAFEEQEYVANAMGASRFSSSILVIYTFVAILVAYGLFIITLFAPTIPVVEGVVSFCLDVAPQFLSLSVIGVVVAFVTVYIP